ncbi:tetratricopeptide repeat protein [Streptomyces sp. NPDC058694]|uniref:tetratricopeptide repeat protein n=1 Tax=Streptomyces sp. NPDC058694 TaxID=3346603 RepID=UPI0036692F40
MTHHDAIAVEDFKPKFLARTSMARKAVDAAVGATKRALTEMGRKHGRDIHLVKLCVHHDGRVMLVRLDLLLASQRDGRIPEPPLLGLAQFPLPLPAFGFRREVFEILQEVPQPRLQRPPRTVAVEGNREAHAPRLASALSNLGADLADRADWSGAVRGAEEALALRRELVSRHPKAFEPQLARLLWWMAGIRLRGRSRPARCVGRDRGGAVRLYSRLASDLPDVYQDDLMAVRQLAAVIHQLVDASDGSAVRSARE